MPRPALRSSALRKIKKRLPGGGTIIHYLRRRPSFAKCSDCGKPLHGVPRERPAVIRRFSKSKKAPSRPYGGNLCSGCTRKRVKETVLSKSGD
jgi:large subunit ribosomal protein L34e